MTAAEKFEALCHKVSACRDLSELCPCSDNNCRARSTRALQTMCQYKYAQVRMEYDKAREQHISVICLADSPSFDEFLNIVETCATSFQCQKNCKCDCHFGRIGNINDTPSHLKNPSIFHQMLCTMRGIQLGSRIDKSSYSIDESSLFTFGGQIVTVGDKEMPLIDALQLFRNPSDDTYAHDTSITAIAEKYECALDATFHYHAMDAGADADAATESVPRDEIVKQHWIERAGVFGQACDCHPNIENFRNAPVEVLDACGVCHAIADATYRSSDDFYMFCGSCDQPFHTICKGNGKLRCEPESEDYVPFFCECCRSSAVCTPDLIQSLQNDAWSMMMDAKRWKYYSVEIRMVLLPTLRVQLIAACHVPTSFVTSSLLIDEGDSKRIFPCPMAYSVSADLPEPLHLDFAVCSMFLSACIHHRDDIHDSKAVRDGIPTRVIETVLDWTSGFGNRPDDDDIFFKYNNRKLKEKIEAFSNEVEEFAKKRKT